MGCNRDPRIDRNSGGVDCTRRVVELTHRVDAPLAKQLLVRESEVDRRWLRLPHHVEVDRAVHEVWIPYRIDSPRLIVRVGSDGDAVTQIGDVSVEADSLLVAIVHVEEESSAPA